jgi:putative ABC transport system permease protein
LFTDVAEYMLYIFMAIIFLALSFGIINTMLMAVLDRAAEIGMLMAIGMNKVKIFRMILMETILLMLTGSLLGLFLSYLLIIITGKYGIDLSEFSSGLAGFGFSSKVYPFLETGGYIRIVIMVVITGILSALIPAKRALKFNPSEAIRN